MNSEKLSSGLTVDKKVMISGSVLALALGTGLGATPAEANLIYTPLNQTVAPGGAVIFGPNGEFTFTNTTTTLGFETLSLEGNSGTGSTNLVAIKDEDPGLRRFNPGEVVDGSANFASSGNDLTFKQSGTIFYGLSISEIDTDPYGWLQITLLPSDDIFLDRFAFQDNEIDGAPIPVQAPEPGTLSILAVGAAAVLVARRRKKKAA